MKNIRNFSIIAHIDHGKSTLADRLLEVTGMGIVVGGVVVFIVLKNEETLAIWQTLKSKAYRAKVIPPNLTGL